MGIPSPWRKAIIVVGLFMQCAWLAGCSGDGGSGGQQTPALLRNWIPGEYLSSSNYRNYCANPRTGNDPFSGQPVRDRQGRTFDENNWLRAIHNELYLWYSEIPDVYDPANYTTGDFFNLQITTMPSATGSNRPKDIFHSSVNTQAFFDTLVMGVNAGYGAEFKVLSSTPPREVVIAYTEPGSPADNGMLGRGARIVSIDGANVVDGDPAILNAGLSPATIGESHVFVVRDLGASTDRQVTLTSSEVTSTPVQNVGIVPGSANVGYILFNDHVATAEAQLIDAINLLETAGVTDLILDLRYNPGGFLDIASELAYMIGGSATTDLTFERLQFNDQYDNLNVNPISGADLETPFYSTVQGFSEGLNEGDDLPTLNANNVVIITSDATCSASEAIINGLRGTSVNVTQVGTTTCGKPYGSVPFGNCGTTYLFTQFQGFNELDQGGYSDGFKPINASGFGEPINGCAVADDFDHDFSDPAEANIAAALTILADPVNFDPATDCPIPPLSTTTIGTQNKMSAPAASQQLSVPKKPGLKIVF